MSPFARRAVARRARAGVLRGVLALALAPALTLVPARGVAQPASLPTDHAGLGAALDSIRVWQGWTLDQQVELTEIEAPPFNEHVRAEAYQNRLLALGFADVRIDAEGNVIAERKGTGDGPVVVLSGHLDTVFPEGTDVTVRRRGPRLYAPGIADDGRGLAVVLTVARAFQQLDLRTVGSVFFVGTVGEEGQGDLRGVRHLFNEDLAGKVDYFISVDGIGYGIMKGAVGSNRYRITFEGPGGHSYGSFGIPNPAHALGRAIARIADLRVPSSPRTTFSVGVLEGGTSVNSIPFEAAMEIDLRSEDPDELAFLDDEVRQAVYRALGEERARWPSATRRLYVRIDTMGIRPAGMQPDSARIVQVALGAAEALDLDSATGTASTDANLPISLGIPAITIGGGGMGALNHTPDEWYQETADAYKGPQWAALIVAALAGLQ